MTSRVTTSQSTASATEKLIAVLEETRSKLMTSAQSEHRFRFVSAAQSLPYLTAYTRSGVSSSISSSVSRGASHSQYRVISLLASSP